jgi:hypothetical protein
MKNSFASKSVLYYPSIEFMNDSWVKAALLFWDKIYRIVPESYKPNDSDEICIAKSEGFVEDIKLNYDDLKATAEDFEKFSSTLEFIPAGFGSTTYEVDLHHEKLDKRLQAFFTTKFGSYDKRGFYSVPSDIASGYMFFLASTASKRRNIAKLTDTRDMFAAMAYFDVNGQFDEILNDASREEQYANIVIENLIPADIECIAMAKVIELHKKIAKYKNEFRESIIELNNTISCIEDVEFAKKEIDTFKRQIMDVNTFRTSEIKSYSKHLCNALLTIGVPTTIQVYFSLFGINPDPYDLFKITASVNAGLIASLSASASKDHRQQWKSSEATYYLKIRDSLGAKDNAHIAFDNMPYLFDEFIND